MALADQTSPTDIALNTDLYELTMAQGFFDAGMLESRAVFSAFFRDVPFNGGYAIACGMGQIAQLVSDFVYTDEAITYLSTLKNADGSPVFSSEFLTYLSTFTPQVNIWAVPEGEVVFGREPLVRVEGPIIAAQLLETALLNLINFQTLVATKTARVVQAANGRKVSDFGLRRAQGPDGGLSVARASYIGGAVSTSNVLAGKIYGIPVFGTHAHSWVMAFSSQLEAFEAFAASSPHNCTLLLDTYDTREGVEDALIVARQMRERGEHLQGVRIDSGDLAHLSKMVRKRFDEAGFPEVSISVSNDLDEYTIQSLLAQGAPIDSFGVGTRLATAHPQGALGGVYKLSAYKSAEQTTYTPVMKVSEMAYKRTIPGITHVLRYYSKDKNMKGDLILDDAYVEGVPSKGFDVLDPDTVFDFSAYEARELLHPVVKDGKPCAQQETLLDAQKRCAQSLKHLDATTKRFMNPQVYPVAIEPGLARLRSKLAREHELAIRKA